MFKSAMRCMVFLLVCSIGAGGQAAFAAIDTNTLNAVLKDIRDDSSTYKTRSISVSILKSDGSLVSAVSKNTNDSIDINTHFSIASVTKTFISACILELARTGQLDLEDTLGDWLYAGADPVLGPALEDDFDPAIQIRDLLNHSSGINDFIDNSLYYAEVGLNVNAVWQPVHSLSYTPAGPEEYPWTHEDGAMYSFKYSNSGYVLLGLVIEKVTGMNVYAALKDMFLRNGSYSLSETYMVGARDENDLYTWLDEIANSANGFEPYYMWGKLYWTRTSNTIGLKAKSTYSSTYTCGNMVSTSADCARWIKRYFEMQLDGDYIEIDAAGGYRVPAGILRVRSDGSTPDDFGVYYAGKDDISRISYGYGIEYYMHTGTNIEVWGHRGSISGFGSLVYYLPEENIAISILINNHYPDGMAVLDRMLEYIDQNK